MEDMQYQFSEALRIKAKKVLEEKCGRTLNDGEIEIMLGRLGQLGMLFVKNVEQGRIKIDEKLED